MTTGHSGASWLFVPGDRPERFPKAQASGADQVVIDLEDAVDPAHKDDARRSVVNWLAGNNAWVRVNAIDTAWHAADLAGLRGAPGLRGVVLPKAEEPAEVEQVSGELAGGVELVLLIETVLGLHHLLDLAQCPAAVRLAFGPVDFSLDIGCAETDQALLLARSQIVLASRLAGLSAPVDGVTTELADLEVTAAAARRARALGFGGKLCVHPAQVDPVAAAFRPAPAELAWAHRVLAASRAAGAVRVDGQMVDRPVVERARRLVRDSAS